MQKYVLFPVLLILLCSCNDRSKEYCVDEIRFNDNAVVVCDELKVKGEKKIPLGSLVDSLQIIRIENGKNAFFKFGWIAISPNYFAIRQSQGGAVKLFDKKGKFLGNIGNVGRGPGEYQNVSDILIDETDGAVYLSQISGDKVLQYNLQGEFVNAITFPERINKPKLFLNPDGTISLVHLCFTDRGNTFTSATFNPAVPDSIKFLYSKDLALSARENEGKSTGYNNEIWSYRNSNDFSFAYTTRDTLYNFNIEENMVKARFVLDMQKERKGKSFFVLNELPLHFLADIVGGEHKKSILIDKRTKAASIIKVVNDYLGNIPTSFRCQDGYFFNILDPISFREKIEEHINSGDCPPSQISKLTSLMETLDEDDNSILLFGKLKESK